MEFAEKHATPVDGEISSSILRTNELREQFHLRWGRIRFEVAWGIELNIKVVLKVYRTDGTCEHFIVDTDPYDLQWNSHRRITRDFYILPTSPNGGRVTRVMFSYIVHLRWVSIPSRYDYLLMDESHLNEDCPLRKKITDNRVALNSYRTCEVDAEILQRDVDWLNRHFESLQIVPKFTKGLPSHPYHPKHYIHEQIDRIIAQKRSDSRGEHSIKVCVDCIDDTDFINHLIHASMNGVSVQCIVDWRKMTLTCSDNYACLKRAGIELLGVFCTPRDPLIEVAPDMHNKFVIFGEQDCILGSFNISFERWWANWESGMTFHSYGVCRLLNNVFQSIRGGVIQRYGIDPLSHFNLLYTFGRHAMLNGKFYRPHHAIISEINRARHSIKLCLFLIGELRGEHHDSVIDALIHAMRRGVDVQIILNGHLAREGDPGKEFSYAEEVRRPLLAAVSRLRSSGVPVALAYGVSEHRVPYCPLHSKYCVIDDHVVLDGSFNWYNTSVFSHDLLVIARSTELARSYIHEFNQILRTFRFPPIKS